MLRLCISDAFLSVLISVLNFCYSGFISWEFLSFDASYTVYFLTDCIPASLNGTEVETKGFN